MKHPPPTIPITLTPLTNDDQERLQRLIEADPDFVRRTEGRDPGPTDAVDLLTQRPPGLSATAKLVLGAVSREGELLAVLDVLRGWPEAHIAHIGLLQVHATQHGRGIGRRAHELLRNTVRRWPEVTTLRAAVVESNAEHAAPFWHAMGYHRLPGDQPYPPGGPGATVSIWIGDV